jgi:hypothetical protein
VHGDGTLQVDVLAGHGPARCLLRLSGVYFTHVVRLQVRMTKAEMSRISTMLNLTEGAPAVAMLSKCAADSRSNCRRGNPLVEQTPTVKPREHSLSLVVWRFGSPSQESLQRLDVEEQRATVPRARRSTPAATAVQRAAAVAVVTPDQGGGGDDGDEPQDLGQVFDGCAIKVLSYPASYFPLLLFVRYFCY